MTDVLKTAKSCRHYAMCKIDFLDTGLCTSGAEKHFVSYYPQGRMDLYAALAENRIPITAKCIEIADSCDLCGKCDCQCYFVTEMKPTAVMKALKEHLRKYLADGGKIQPEKTDSVLEELKTIVGDFWATSDPAIALTYSHDPSPVAMPRLPAYVIMPNSTAEISSIVKLLNNHKIPYAVRGNGSSVMGFVMSEGAVIDIGRMKTLKFDENNWLVKIGAGVSAYDLQKAAVERGYRVNVAEPSALVCSNIMCSGIFSVFSTTYGTAADNFIDAEFVGTDGEIFRLSDKNAPNLMGYHKGDEPLPGICTKAYIKLHAITPDEEGAFVPFETLESALDFAKECAVRKIGIAIGVLGGEYLSTFLSPTQKLAEEVKQVFKEKLKIENIVLVIGDKYALNSIKMMGHKYFDNRMIRTLNLGLPSLVTADWIDLMNELAGDEPYSYLGLKSFPELAEAALNPSAQKLVQGVDPELRPFFEKLYTKPEMTDPVWLNMFRIISSRMGREKHVVPMIIYLPMDKNLISAINNDFKRIADGQNLKNDYGFITPIDDGKRCVFEYDYYVDQNDPEDITRMRNAMMQAGAMIEKYSAETGTVLWIRYVFSQGFSRKENYLYNTAEVDK